jgi:hypothetical protein
MSMLSANNSQWEVGTKHALSWTAHHRPQSYTKPRCEYKQASATCTVWMRWRSTTTQNQQAQAYIGKHAALQRSNNNVRWRPHEEGIAAEGKGATNRRDAILGLGGVLSGRHSAASTCTCTG